LKENHENEREKLIS